MNKIMPLMLVLAALLAPTTVSAEWTDDNEYECVPTTCPGLLLCVEDAPPQVVDTALHCVDVAPSRAPGVVDTLAYYGYNVAEYVATLGYNVLIYAYESNQPDLTEANALLCGTVWSHFCANPLAYPEWQDVEDPFGPYPL